MFLFTNNSKSSWARQLQKYYSNGDSLSIAWLSRNGWTAEAPLLKNICKNFGNIIYKICFLSFLILFLPHE
jgi:hypothetical protein